MSQLSARTASATIVLQVLARASGAIMAIAVTAIVTRSVGVATYADWATTVTIVGLFSFMLDPGVSPVVVRRLIQDPASSPTLRSLLVARLVVVAVTIGVAVLVVVALRGTGTALLAAVLAAQLLPRSVVLNVGTVLQADHRLHRLAFLEVVTGAAGLIATAIAASYGVSAPVLALTGISGPVLLLSLLASSQLPGSPSTHRFVRGDDRARLRSIVREIAPLAFALALVALYSRIQVLFVNLAEPARGVAEYLLAFMVVDQLLIVASIVGAVLMPFFADRARDGVLHHDPLAHDVHLALGAVGAIVGGLILTIASPAMLLLGGQDLRGASSDLLLLVPMSVAIFIAVSLSYTYAAMEQSRRYLRFNLIGLALAIALNAALTLRWGAPAAARTTWIVEFVVVGIAIRPLVQDKAGKRVVVRLALIGAAAVVASEAAYSGSTALLCGPLLATAALLGSGSVRRLLLGRLGAGRA